jgi:hypothetical protein
MSDINCLESFIKALREIDNRDDLDNLTEKHDDFNLLCGSTSTFTQNADDELSESVLQIELSAGHYIFNDLGLVIRQAVDKLKANGFELIKLGEAYKPFTHGVKTSKVVVLVSN